MKACPSHSSPEYKALEASGLSTYEIYKYWADHDNTLGTPDEVRYYTLSDEEKAFLSERNQWTEEEMERMNEEGPSGTVSYARQSPLAHFKKEIGLYKRENSTLQVALINQRIKTYNDKYDTGHFIPWKKVGQSDLRTYDVINEVWNNFNPDQGDIFNAKYRGDPESLSEQEQQRANEIAQKLIARLTADSNIEVVYTDSEGAKRATKDTKNPYGGEPVFFLGDIIYVVTDKLTINMVLHEFSHPIFRSMWKNPKTFELFNKLYNDLANTDEGKAIITEVTSEYSDYLVPGSEMFKEEVLVRGLASKAENLRNSIKDTPGFAKVIKNILYAIKQFLRRIFKGPIHPENLDVSTTLDQLAEMFINDHFVIDTEVISEEEAASYMREDKKHIDSLFGKGLQEKIQPFLKRLWDVTLQTKVKAFESENYPEMLRLIQNEFDLNLLSSIRSNINKHKDIITSKMEDSIEKDKILHNQSAAFVSSVYQLQVIIKNMSDEIDSINQSKRTKEDVLRVQFIKEAIMVWEGFLTDKNTGAKQQLIDEGMPEDDPFISLIGSIGNTIEKINHRAAPILKEGIDIMLTDILEVQSKNIDELYKPMIENARKKGLSKAVIKTLEEEYEGLRLYPGKIRDMLSGMGDANYLNNMMEGWLYSTDEVVGGMGVFFKNTHNNIQNAVQSRFNDFVDTIVPLAREAGIDLSSSDVGTFARKLLFIDNKPTWEDGEIKQHQVYTFINHLRDYRWTIADINDRLQKAETKFNETNTDDDKEALNKVQQEKDDLDKLFWRQYIDPYYDRNKIFESPLGQEAKRQRDEIYKDINILESMAEKEGDLMVPLEGHADSISEQIKVLRSKLRWLYSLKNKDGSPKREVPDDPLLNDLGIAKILIENREINRHFFEYKLRPGIFQKKLSEYELELVKSGLAPDSKEFELRRQQWLDSNTVIATTPEYQERVRDIFKQIKQIYNTIPNPSADSKELAEAYKEVNDILSGYRDDDGQPVGVDMADETINKLKTLQERIEALNKKIRNTLTSDQVRTLESLESQLEERGELSDKQQKLYNTLSKKLRPEEGVDSWDNARLSALWKELRELQGKEPTEYYLDTFNEFLSQLPDELKEQLIDLNNTASMNVDNAQFIVNLPKDILKDMINSVPGFKEWFRANHIQREFWDSEKEKLVKEWYRIAAWSVTRPLSEEYLEYTPVTDINGNKTAVQGKPIFSLRFYERLVKPQFHTGYDENTGKVKLVPGLHIDPSGPLSGRNVKWLPDPNKSDRFNNDQYTRLKSTHPDSQEGKLFKVLEKVKELYLDTQKGSDKYAKLGYDFPKIRIKTSEALLSKGLEGAKVSATQSYWRRFKSFFQRRKDDPDSGYNLRDEIMLTEEEYFKADTSKDIIPVTGIYDIDIKEVSLDLFHGVAMYMAGLERQRQLAAILPFFKATLDVLENPANTAEDVSRVQKRNRVMHVNRPFLKSKKGQKFISNRYNALSNKIQREFYGQTTAGLFHDSKGLQGLINMAFKGASFSYLALQIPAAITNMTVQVLQNVIRSAGGENFNTAELAEGSIWAGKVSLAITNEVYRKESHSLIVQLTEIFDPIPGRFLANSLGQSQGRSIVRDFASFSWLYSPRKFMENYATLQAFGAMMSHVKIDQSIKGVTSKIKYINAWELVDNKIQLKKGIDPTYAQGGKEFNWILIYMQNVQHDMNGAYDSFSQPEAYRYLIYRMYAFLRKYVTTMLTNRFGITRRSPGMMRIKTGFYTATGKVLYRALTMDPKYLKNMSAPEKAATRQFLTEMGVITLMWLMFGLFGWDPDDDERYAKLREKSGPLPLPFVPETENPFNASGWLSNHMLLQLLKLKSQTEMWIPLPGFGLNDYTSLLSMTPVVFGPTIDLYARSVDITLRMAAGDTRAYYQRDIGPYAWQKEDMPKLYNYFGQTLGLRGSLTEPSLAIQKQEQSRVLK